MTNKAPIVRREPACEASLRAEYLHLQAVLWPEGWVARDETGYLYVVRTGEQDRLPDRDALLDRWRELRYRLLNPWWVLTSDPLLAVPSGVHGRGQEAILIMFGVLIYLRELIPPWDRVFFRPDEAEAFGIDPATVGAATVLLIRHGPGGIGCSFGGVGYGGVVLPREMRRALRSGGFMPRNVLRGWTALDDAWAEPDADVLRVMVHSLGRQER